MVWQEAIQQIKSLDEQAMAAAKAHWDAIGKPLNSLGLLEKIVQKIAGMTGNSNVALTRKCVAVFCADNGVVAEGVTQTDSSVTAIVAENMAKGIANVNAMARVANAPVFPVDIGICTDVYCENLRVEKVAYGTQNFLHTPAMTRAQAEAAIGVGVHLVQQLREQGFQIIATGEMGIGNTTTSSAVLSVLLGEPPEAVTGRGAGLSNEGLRRKQTVIQEAIRLHQPNPEDPIDVLAKVGGLDIAGLVGVFLGGAIYQVPIVLDGLISGTAALIAARIQPLAASYMLASHLSREPAAQKVLELLSLQPIIHGNLALGEGTGAVTLFPLLDMTLSVYQQDTTFAKINIPQYTPFDGAQS